MAPTLGSARGGVSDERAHALLRVGRLAQGTDTRRMTGRVGDWRAGGREKVVRTWLMDVRPWRVCAGVDGRGAGTVDEQAGAAVSQATPLRLLERGQKRGVGIRSGDIGRRRGSWPWRVCVCDAAPRLRTEGCLRDVLSDLRPGGRVCAAYAVTTLGGA
jgi:hypothetical protein